MTVRRPTPFFLALIAALAAAAPAGLAAQGFTLHGRVVDGSGNPVPNQEVTFHHVSSSGGTAVAHATSGPDGAFTVDLTKGTTDGISFASARYKGDLYVGPPFKGVVPANAEYVLVVGSPATEGTNAINSLLQDAGMGDMATPAATTPVIRARDATLFWTGLVVLVLVAGAAVLLMREQRPAGPSPVRLALMEIAAVEEHLAARGRRSPAETAMLSRLREALKQSAGTGTHAADQ